MRHHLGQTQKSVKIRPPDADPVIGQNVPRPIRRPRPFGRHPHDGKVGCAAANIDDQHQFFARNALLILQRRRNRFILKRHLAKAQTARNLLQRRLRLGIARRITIDKMHRTPQHNPIRPRRMKAQHLYHMPHKPRQNLAERHRARPNCRALVNHARAKRAF